MQSSGVSLKQDFHLIFRDCNALDFFNLFAFVVQRRILVARGRYILVVVALNIKEFLTKACSDVLLTPLCYQCKQLHNGGFTSQPAVSGQVTIETQQ